jgi:hypothetical protein
MTMNPISRIGQRVICVQHPSIWPTICSALRTWPQLDQVYTVAGFATIEDLPGIHLRELAGVTCACFDLVNAPWPLECFRPVQTRETDIGALKQLLNDANERQRDLVTAD